MRLLVTGAGGLLGGAVVATAEARGWEVVGATRQRADVRDGAAVDRLVREVRPDAVVHCAYVLDGPSAEETIVAGSGYVAAAAATHGARLVHLSSDRVFAGGETAHRERDEPDPIDPYGMAKAAAERAVAGACPGAAVVRTSLLWRLEPPAHVVQAVVDALDGRSRMAFFVDEVRCPTHVDDLALACVELCSRPDVTGPLHLAGTVAVSRYDLARGVAAALGLDPDLVPAGPRADYGLPRPSALVLDSARAAGLLGWAPRPPPAPPPPGTGRVRRRSS